MVSTFSMFSTSSPTSRSPSSGLSSSRLRTGANLAALLICAGLAGGCGVTRTLHVDSSPAGATVLLDGRPVGATPYTEVFLSYGVRRLELRHEGHARDVREIDVVRPWWQYFPLSFFSDLLWPAPLTDDHYVAVELIPAHRVGGEFGDAQDAFAQLQALKRLLAAREAAFHGHRPGAPGAPSDPGADATPDPERPASDEPDGAHGANDSEDSQGPDAGGEPSEGS